MKYLYYCNSLYQVINVIRIQGEKNKNGDKGDVIIQLSFPGAKKIASNLEKQGLFENVYTFEKDKKSIGNHLKRINELLFPRLTLIKRFGLDIDNDYDKIIIPKVNQFIGMLWRLNKKAITVFYEDGVGSYFEQDRIKSFSSKKYNSIYRFLNHGRGFEDIDTLYLNSPELALDQGFKILQIPRMSREYIRIMSEVFSYINVTPFDKLNWISQKTGWNNFKMDDESYLDLIKDKSHLLYRQHPRYLQQKPEGIRCDNPEEPFELKVLLDPTIEEKTFISHFSTASVVPKLLFNREPKEIFLYRTWDSDYSKIDAFVERLKKAYKNKDKIIVVKKEEDFIREI